MLVSFLDMYRDVIVWKVEDLSEEQARVRQTAAGIPLLNLVVHLTGVEKNWFENIVAGRTIDRDRAAEFGELDTSVADAVETYRAQCGVSNEVVEAVDSLDDPCAGEAGYSVRWVMLHVLEEIARHAGHADITRELIDGATGFSRYDKD